MKYVLYNGAEIEAIYNTLEEVALSGGPRVIEISDGALAAEQRAWRNLELKSTDWIVPIIDHPQRNLYLAYRTALRDWPSTSDFPDTKPTL